MEVHFPHIAHALTGQAGTTTQTDGVAAPDSQLCNLNICICFIYYFQPIIYLCHKMHGLCYGACQLFR